MAVSEVDVVASKLDNGCGVSFISRDQNRGAKSVVHILNSECVNAPPLTCPLRAIYMRGGRIFPFLPPPLREQRKMYFGIFLPSTAICLAYVYAHISQGLLGISDGPKGGAPLRQDSLVCTFRGPEG